MRLWDFAVSLYARPGVEAACLTLQDEHDCSVPLLLWRLWALDRRIDASTLKSAVVLTRDWEERATVPLRAVRRRLADPSPPIPESARLPLREAVKSAELAAERILLEGLEALTPKDEARGGAAINALIELADIWSKPAPILLLTHIAAAAASVTACPAAETGYGHER